MNELEAKRSDLFLTRGRTSEQTRDMFGNNISFQGADAITPIFWDDSPSSGARRQDAAAVAVAADEGERQLMQVGVRQVAREGGLFEIIFYPFKEANGTLEVRVGSTWSTTFPIAPRAVFQPMAQIEQSQRLIIFAPVSSFVLGLVIALVINRVQASYQARKQRQRMEEELAAAEKAPLAGADAANSPAADPEEEGITKKPEMILGRLLKRNFVSDQVNPAT